MLEENRIATLVLDAAFKGHRALGPGLLGMGSFDSVPCEQKALRIPLRPLRRCGERMDPLSYGPPAYFAV